jgi:thiamine biosynthesis lipoprotein
MSILLVSALPCLVEPVRSEERAGQLEETRSSFLSMGCSAKCVLYGRDREQNRRTQQDLVELLGRIEKIASFYDPGSEVNSLPRGEWVPVSSELMEMLALSKRLHKETNGAFDITLGRLKALWDSTRRSHTMPSTAAINRALEASGMEKIELRPPSVRISDASLNLDLSAVAKGYAIDQGIRLLKSAGVKGGMISLGGDIRVFGQHGAGGGNSWPVGIQDPRLGGRLLGRVSLEEGAIATSGNYERFAVLEEKDIGHIFHPGANPFSSGRAARSVTIVSSSCAEADALATAVFAMGREKGVAFLEQQPSVIGYLVVSGRDHELRYDKRMRILDFSLAEQGRPRSSLPSLPLACPRFPGKSFVRDELFEFLSGRGLGLEGRTAEREDFHDFESFRDRQDLPGLLVIDGAHVNGSQPERMGCQSDVLGSDSQVKHVPVPFVRGEAVAVQAGLAPLRHEDEEDGCLLEALGRRILRQQCLLEGFLPAGILDDDDPPGLYVYPGRSPSGCFEYLGQVLVGDRILCEPSYAAAFPDGLPYAHSSLLSFPLVSVCAKTIHSCVHATRRQESFPHKEEHLSKNIFRIGSQDADHRLLAYVAPVVDQVRHPGRVTQRLSGAPFQ